MILRPFYRRLLTTGTAVFGVIYLATDARADAVATAIGAGADVEMREQNNNSANSTAMNSRTSVNNDRNEIIGLRFDLSGYSPASLSNVTLNLIAFRTDSSTRVVDLYGVTPGTAAAEGVFTTESWDETALPTFGSLPGLLATDGNYVTQSIDSNNVTFLGQISVPGNSVSAGGTNTFDQAPLTSWVQNQSGPLVNFLLAAGNDGTGQFRIASKEADALDPASGITGTAGDFAPFLEFDATPAPPPGDLLITNISIAGSTVMLSGSGGSNSAMFALLATSNLLDPIANWEALTTNSFDSGGNFYVTNAFAPASTAQFFRLQWVTPPMPVPPSITDAPDDVTVLAGETAMFNVVAAGDPTLHYQWVFNASTLLPGQTSATLTLSNVVAGQAGDYSVTVSNVAGVVTSSVATLTVNVPALVITHPTNQTVIEDGAANLIVVAGGTTPLFYQWYFNTSNLLTGATADVLSIGNVSTNDSGAYSVVVTNLYGVATSQVATLTVTPSNALPDFGLYGFATVNGTVTGGAGGVTQTVATATAFRNAVGTTSPGVVQVSGVIDLAGSATVRARKTIVGLGTDAAIVGTLNISGTTVSNVIVRNLTISSPAGDGITIISGAHHIWVDHCTFFDCSDGQLDITEQADFVTVSWCKFNYTTNSGHNFSMLIGASDSSTGDRGKLNVTLHHNWWSPMAIERMPRLRFGDVHSFNNYFNAPGNNYCIRAALESEVLIERNCFQNVDEPWTLQVTAGTTNGMMQAVENLLINCTSTNTPANDTVFTPPYFYPVRAAADVPGVVTNYAGVGKGPFAP